MRGLGKSEATVDPANKELERARGHWNYHVLHVHLAVDADVAHALVASDVQSQMCINANARLNALACVGSTPQGVPCNSSFIRGLRRPGANQGRRARRGEWDLHMPLPS